MLPHTPAIALTKQVRFPVTSGEERAQAIVAQHTSTRSTQPALNTNTFPVHNTKHKILATNQTSWYTAASLSPSCPMQKKKLLLLKEQLRLIVCIHTHMHRTTGCHHHHRAHHRLPTSATLHHHPPPPTPTSFRKQNNNPSTPPQTCTHHTSPHSKPCQSRLHLHLVVVFQLTRYL